MTQEFGAQMSVESQESLPARTSSAHSAATLKTKVLILLSTFVIVAFQFALSFAMQRFQIQKPDFASLYQAGRKIDHSRFPWIAAHFPQMNSQEYTVLLNGHEFPADTLHPPYEMVLYAALSLLKFHTAYLTWWACNVALLLFTAAVLWQHIPNLQRSYPYLLILIATFFPVLVALVQGQTSIVLLTALSLSYHFLDRRKHVRAGIFLSMGMFKFVLVLPIALWLLLEKRWKSMAGFLAGCGFLFFASIWLVGISGTEDYARALAGLGKKGPEQAGTESIMPNLRGLFHAIGAGWTPEALLIVLTLLTSIALLVWVNSRRGRQLHLNVRFSLQVLLATLISYHLYPHDGAVLVFPVLLLLNDALQEGADRRFKIGCIVCACCAYLLPLVGPLNVTMPAVCAASLSLLILARIMSVPNSLLEPAGQNVPR